MRQLDFLDPEDGVPDRISTWAYLDPDHMVERGYLDVGAEDSHSWWLYDDQMRVIEGVESIDGVPQYVDTWVYDDHGDETDVVFARNGAVIEGRHEVRDGDVLTVEVDSGGDGTVDSIVAYELDKRGEFVWITVDEDADGVVDSVANYTKGLLTRREDSASSTTYTYDRRGHPLTRVRVAQDASGVESTSTMQWAWDRDRELEFVSDVDGVQVETRTTTWDGSRELERVTERGEYLQTEIWSWSAWNAFHLVTENSEGVHTEKTVVENQRGYPVEETRLDEDGVVTRIERDYDCN